MIGEGCCGRGVERNGGKGKDGVGESRGMNEESSRVAAAGTFCLFDFFQPLFFSPRHFSIVWMLALMGNSTPAPC